MRILLIGSGGRESALAWKISQSPLLEKGIPTCGKHKVSISTVLEAREEERLNSVPEVSGEL